MKRTVLVLASLALVAVACAPSPSLPPLPEAGCYYVSVPGGWGSAYFTGEAPTPSNPYNFRTYIEDADCSPSALAGYKSGVNAANELDAFRKCLEQAGFLTSPPHVTAETTMRLGPAFHNVWMCYPV